MRLRRANNSMTMRPLTTIVGKTDVAMKEADPDRYNSPILREPALDVLSPLTAEDYRKPDAPPAVNPCVTHAEFGI